MRERFPANIIWVTPFSAPPRPCLVGRECVLLRMRSETPLLCSGFRVSVSFSGKARTNSCSCRTCGWVWLEFGVISFDFGSWPESSALGSVYASLRFAE